MKIKFSGNQLKGSWKFNKENGGIWTIAKSNVQEFESKFPADVIEQKNTYDYYIPQKTDIRFEVDTENLQGKRQYNKIWDWVSTYDTGVILEPKLRGLRTVATSEGEIYLEGNEIDRASRYPEISRALIETLDKGTVIDGETVDETLHVFSILALEGNDLRNKSELERKQILTSRVKPNKPELVLIPYQVIKSEKKLLTALRSALEYENSEGAMLKAVNAVTSQKRNSDWAKVKSIIRRVAVVQGKDKVADKEAWTYQLGFKDEDGEIYSPGTSMSMGDKIKKGTHVIVSLPASGIWETPLIQKTTTKPVSKVTFTQRIVESGTPLWVECEIMEAELPGADCERTIKIIGRCIWIQNNYVYPGEATYASELQSSAEGHKDEVCIPKLTWDERTLYIEDVAVGDSGTGEIVIYNEGSGPLELYDISLTYQEYFSIVAGGELGQLDEFEVRGIVIEFTPDEPGVFHTDMLNVSSNDSDNPTITFSIYGFASDFGEEITVPRIGPRMGILSGLRR